METQLNVFDYDDYREFLHELIKGPASVRGLHARVSRAMGCQPPYLTQILNGKSQMTEDQGYKLTLFLQFTEEEREYFLTILRISRCSTFIFKNYLNLKQQQLKDQRMTTGQGPVSQLLSVPAQ